MKCKHCGNEIVDDSVFCEYCGKKVRSASKSSLHIIIIITVVLLAMAIIVGLLRRSSVPLAGTVLSYTERVTSEEGDDDVISYFVFRDSNEVIWLMGTSRQNMFPVGFGEYNSSTGEMSFSVTDTLHQGVSIYYGVEDAIVFNFDMAKKTAVLKTDNEWLKPFYNEGNVFALNKEDYSLKPSEALVESHWRGSFGNGFWDFSFKSWNEVLVEDDGGFRLLWAYVCFDDMVSVKFGDNLEYENFIGKYQGGDEMTLCRKGLDTVSHSNECITLYRITVESDTEAFQACQTVDDFRAYICRFGRNARNYAAAKKFVDEYESDSIAYAGCTTIKACDAYLDTYPNGHFVEEVKAKKAELQNNQNHGQKQGNISVLTDSNIDNFIASSYKIPVIIDFYGDWCPPCKKMKPVLNELIKEYNGRVSLGRFVVDNMQEQACKKYGIKVVPILLFIKNGEIVGRHVGFSDGDKIVIRNEIEQYFFKTDQHGNDSQKETGGVFSVSASKKVRFAQGNLQYHALTRKWRFAEHQWDCIGNDNSRISDTYGGWIDLFGWGTGDEPTKKHGSIADCSPEGLAAMIYIPPEAPPDSAYLRFTDWGKMFGGGWYTLSKKEWEYVVETRITSSGIRYVMATVAGVHGLILLPDDWNTLNYGLKNHNQIKASFDSNLIDASTWNRIFMPAGAAFLPASGVRGGSNVYFVNSYGAYWASTTSSTPHGRSCGYADCLFFGDGSETAVFGCRSYGQSVRLVRTVK